MKKTLSLLLALALCLALAAPALAADPLGDAMRAYAGIVAGASGYDFGDETGVESKSYTYALVETTDSPGIPTLLLSMNAEGYWIGSMSYTRVFRYDTNSRSVIAPDTLLISGTASAGGFRGSVGLCNGLLSTHQWAAMTGMGDVCTYTVAGGELKSTTVWSGRIDEIPAYLDGGAIGWMPVSDTAAFAEYAAPAPAPAETKPAVVLSPQSLVVDGQPIQCEKYNIDGSNYFKLRDIAALLKGTPVEFDVSYDAAANAVVIAPGLPYQPIGGELETGTDKSASAVPSPQSVWFLDAPVALSAYNIGGNNFFKLRELGDLLGFHVDYSEETNTAFIFSSTEPGPGGGPEEGWQAKAFDDLWLCVAENSNYSYEDNPAYRISGGDDDDDGVTVDFVIVDESTESGRSLRLAYYYGYGDGSYDIVWTELQRHEKTYPTAYGYYVAGNEGDTPDFFGELDLVPGEFSGNERVTFQRTEGTPEYDMERLATLSIAFMLDWLRDFAEEQPRMEDYDVLACFGFTPAATESGELEG